MAKPKIIPAVLAPTMTLAQRRINRLKVLHTPIHLDLMDGRFVSTRSFGRQSLSRLKLPPHSSAHLMVEDPSLWIQACANVGIRNLILHVESKITPNLLQKLRERFRITLAVKPGTPQVRLTPYLRYASGIQVMTVHPGKQGRPFLPRQLNVVRKLRRKFPTLPLSVDGGMDESTIPRALAAGASGIVVGSAIVQSKNPLAVCRKLAHFLL